MKNPDEIATDEFVLASNTGGLRPVSTAPRVHVEFHGQSHEGLVRSNNEDQFLVCRFGRQLEILQTTLTDLEPRTRFDETGCAMVVADGMGGAAAGEVASQLAMHSLLELVISTPDWIMRLDDEHWSEEIAARFRVRAGQMNQTLMDAVESEPDWRGFGTTMTAAWNLGHHLFVASIGDSRGYLLRNGKLHQLTNDHTLAQELADRGALSQADAATHRLRHVLTKVLGGGGQSFEPDVQKIILEDGDSLLLCTDGLTEMVSDQAVGETMALGISAEDACNRLVDQALEAGGKDNVTVIVVRYRFSSEQDTRASGTE